MDSHLSLIVGELHTAILCIVTWLEIQTLEEARVSLRQSVNIDTQVENASSTEQTKCELGMRNGLYILLFWLDIL